MLCSPKLTILLIILLILGSLTVGLYAAVILWPVVDTEKKSALIICLGGKVRARQEKSLKLLKEGYGKKLLLTNQANDFL